MLRRSTTTGRAISRSAASRFERAGHCTHSRNDHPCVGNRARIHRGMRIFDVGQFAARLLHADRVVRAHLGPCEQQVTAELTAPRACRSVSGSKGRPSTAMVLPRKAADHGTRDLARHRALGRLSLTASRPPRCADGTSWSAPSRQLAGILRETRAAKPGPALQEFGAMRCRADAARLPERRLRPFRRDRPISLMNVILGLGMRWRVFDHSAVRGP